MTIRTLNLRRSTASTKATHEYTNNELTLLLGYAYTKLQLLHGSKRRLVCFIQQRQSHAPPHFANTPYLHGAFTIGNYHGSSSRNTDRTQCHSVVTLNPAAFPQRQKEKISLVLAFAPDNNATTCKAMLPYVTTRARQQAMSMMRDTNPRPIQYQ